MSGSPGSPTPVAVSWDCGHPPHEYATMKRRSFLQTSVAALGAAATSTVASGAGDSTAQEIYELRAYSLAVAKQPVLDRYLGEAFIPALKRLGIGPIGVFAEKTDKDVLKVYVLIVYP